MGLIAMGFLFALTGGAILFKMNRIELNVLKEKAAILRVPLVFRNGPLDKQLSVNRPHIGQEMSS